MTVHQPRRPVSEREIQETNELFGDLLTELDAKAGNDFTKAVQGEKKPVQGEATLKDAVKKPGIFSWLRGPKGFA